MMKVKIGDKTHNSKDEPIMLYLTKKDKELIVKMAVNNYRYCEYPSHLSSEDISEWMYDKIEVKDIKSKHNEKEIGVIEC